VPQVEELNRLIALGLSPSVAMEVANGTRDEVFEVRRALEKCEVDIWCKGRTNLPKALTAVWDCSPANFYLAFDGDSPADHEPSDFALIEADVDDVNGQLTYATSRDKDPWHESYKSKSCGIAFRWLKGAGVTPPLLGEFEAKVHLIGGMHRFHLAKYYGTKRMPFLVRTIEIEAVMALIQSANVSVNN